LSGRRRRSIVGSALALGAVMLMAGTALADLPTADPQSVATDHAVAKTITLTGTAAAGLADFNITTDPTHGGLDAETGAMTCDSPPACHVDVLYTPTASYEGPDTFAFTVGNGTDGTSDPATVSIAVGSAPVAADDPDVSCAADTAGGTFVTLEDNPLTVGAASPCGLLANDTDADAGDTLTASRTTDGSLGSATVGGTGGFTYTPDANRNGADTFTYDASDGVLSDTGTVHVSIVAVNDVPSFTAGGAQTVDEDGGAATVTGWATGISAGPFEGSQTVDFIVADNDHPELFSAGPAVAANGTLTFTPAANANGTAHVAIKIHDNGGTNNFGVDTSATQSLTITIDPVNDAPSFTNNGGVTVNEDSGAYSQPGWVLTSTPGPSDESGQTITYSVTDNTNTSLFSSQPAVAANGTLTFTPATNGNGSADVTVVAVDNGGGTDTSAPSTVTITVNPVNDAPNAVNDTGTGAGIPVPENSAGTILDVLANDSSLPDAPEPLTVTSAGDLTHGPFHGTVTVALDGSSVTYKPTAGYYGADSFPYTISDNDPTTPLTDTATVVVNVVKDATPPTVTTPLQHIRTGVTMTSTALLGTITWTGTDTGVGIDHYTVQRSVNGGTFASLTLSTPTATSLNVTYGFSGATYRFRVRAVDRNGNVGAWANGPTFTTSRSQETSGYFKYSGFWATTSNVNDSGGAAKYAGTAGKSVTFTRSFRDVAFVAPKSSTRGSADIYVDGVKVATVSLKSSTGKYRQVIWTAHFNSKTTHTVRIVVVGNGRIDLDCFVILS
jgi:cadherin-like protein/Big-like domain-containing protein